MGPNITLNPFMVKTHMTQGVCLIGSNVAIFITNMIFGGRGVVNSIYMKPGGCFCTQLCQKSFIFHHSTLFWVQILL